MEAFSIEDNGEGVMFNVYVLNVQSEVTINYADGSSVGPEGPSQEGEVAEYNSGGNDGDSNGSSGGSSEPSPAPTPKPEPKPELAPEPEPAPVEGNVSAIDTNGNGTVTIAEAETTGYSMPITSENWLYPHMIDRDGDGMVGE